MTGKLNRRRFLASALGTAAAGGIGLTRAQAAVADQVPPKAPDHFLTVVAGKPRERGRRYGRKFEEGIRAFLDKERSTVRQFKVFSATTNRRSANITALWTRCSSTARTASPTSAAAPAARAGGRRLDSIKRRDGSIAIGSAKQNDKIGFDGGAVGRVECAA